MVGLAPEQSHLRRATECDDACGALPGRRAWRRNHYGDSAPDQVRADVLEWTRLDAQRILKPPEPGGSRMAFARQRNLTKKTIK